MARGLNKVLIIGNLGARSQDALYAQRQACTSFSVAVSAGGRPALASGETTEWFNVVAWGTLAEVNNQFLRKGSRVYVEPPQTRSWDDPDGQRQIANRSGRDRNGVSRQPSRQQAGRSRLRRRDGILALKTES